MVHERRIAAGGRRFRYLEAGAGWPVLLIHAFPLNADMWWPQLEETPDGWRFLAPDLRGFGPEAEWETSAPTMDDFASDLGGFLDALEIERAVIGGLSMGGYVAFALFRQAPERFSGLVLADTKPQADTPEARQARRTMSELVRASGAAALADEMLPKLLSPATLGERPQVARDARRLIAMNAVTGIDGAIHALLTRPDSTADLERIACPTLVIVGEDDAITPVADSEALHRQIARSLLVVLPGAGHLSNLETPDAFSRALTDFLRSNI